MYFLQATFGSLQCQNMSNLSPPTSSSPEIQSALFPPPPPPPASSMQVVPQPPVAREESSPSPTFSTVSSNGERSASGCVRVGSAFIPSTSSSLLNGYVSSVTSSPVSSYDSEISQITGYGIASKTETPPVQSPSMSSATQNSICGLTSIQEYNLTQLASLADKVHFPSVQYSFSAMYLCNVCGNSYIYFRLTWMVIPVCHQTLPLQCY